MNRNLMTALWPALWMDTKKPLEDRCVWSVLRQAVIQDYGRISRDAPPCSFGPGRLEECHAVNEYVEAESYLEAILVYAQLILEWCKANK